jgi:hypothetical protein
MTGLTIIPVWDKSVLDSPDKVEFEDAVEKAIANIEAKITTKETIKIDFGYGVMPYDDSSTGPGGAESVGNTAPYSWTQVYDAFEKIAKSASASAVQKAAAALLTKDNAKYAAVLNNDMMDVTEAEAKALGLSLAGFAGSGPYDGWVGLGSGPFDWAQNNPNQEDAVSAFEHEITEVMGRVDNLGVPNGNPGDYTLLDMFHYGASPGATTAGAAPGSAAGALDEPFVAGYNAKDVSYFSYNGSTITWQYDTPAEVNTFGEDVADWSTTNTNRPAATDSFDGAGGDAIDPPVSLPDWEEMGVLGYAEKPAVALVDFNGDSLSDIAWRGTGGAFSIWDSNGSGGFNRNVHPGPMAASWSVAGVGDFNGDGHSDILWQTAAGATELWLSNDNGGGFVTDNLGTVATSWHVAGVGDFSGDGEAGILWRNNATGADMIWESNGAGGFIKNINPGSMAASWSVAGVGDFNGDGRSDILWRNSSGATELWLSNDKGGFATDDLGMVATSWQVAGVGDFNGDGEASILWRNKTTGADMIWESNGAGGFVKNVNPGSMGANWSVAGIGDFNGDGVDGILWRSTSGATELWDSNGAGGFVAHNIGNVPLSWKIVAA